jgi:hypothetical protein
MYQLDRGEGLDQIDIDVSIEVLEILSSLEMIADRSKDTIEGYYQRRYYHRWR